MSAITITNAGLSFFRDGVRGTQNAKITYVALGTSSTAPATSDTHLGLEVFRKKCTSFTAGSTGVITVSMYLSPTDTVGTDIEEVGFFSGNASTTLNSGILVAHGLFSHNPKTGVESIQFDFVLTFA